MKNIGEIVPALLTSQALVGRQSEEHVSYGIRTQVLVPLVQGIALIGGVGLFFAGLGLLAWTVVDLALLLTSVVDMLFASAVVALALLIVSGLVRDVTARLEWQTRFWRSVTGYVAAIAVVLLLIDVIHVTVNDWDRIELVRLFLGFALTAAGLLLCWRFGQELANPLYPKSPLIAFMDRLLDKFGAEQEQVEVMRPYPVHRYGHLDAIGYNDSNLTTDEPDEPESSPIDPKFLDLIRFVELSAEWGFARDDSQSSRGLVTKPRHLLPSGRRLTRAVYDELMATAEKPWRIITRDKALGTTDWRMEPIDALDMLRAIRDEIQSGRQAGDTAGRQPGI